MSRKSQAAVAIALLSVVSTACLEGMKKIGEMIEERQEKEQENGKVAEDAEGTD